MKPVKIEHPDIVRKRKNKLYLSFFGLVLVLSGLIYLIIKTDLFMVKSVSVKGNKLVPEEVILRVANIRYIWQGVELGNWPIIVESLETDRHYISRTIDLKVKEREQYGTWCYLDDCVWFDKTGLAFARAPKITGTLIRQAEGRQPVDIGEFVLEEDKLIRFLGILGILDDLSLRVREIEMGEDKYREMTVRVDSNVPIYFSLRGEIEFVRQALTALKKDLGRLAYIDLRSENRAFYRYR